MIDSDAACTAIEDACPGLHYVVILLDPLTKELIQAGNIPPEMQRFLLSYNLKEMRNLTPEVIELKAKNND